MLVARQVLFVGRMCDIMSRCVFSFVVGVLVLLAVCMCRYLLFPGAGAAVGMLGLRNGVIEEGNVEQKCLLEFEVTIGIIIIVGWPATFGETPWPANI